MKNDRSVCHWNEVCHTVSIKVKLSRSYRDRHLHHHFGCIQSDPPYSHGQIDQEVISWGLCVGVEWNSVTKLGTRRTTWTVKILTVTDDRLDFPPPQNCLFPPSWVRPSTTSPLTVNGTGWHVYRTGRDLTETLVLHRSISFDTSGLRCRPIPPWHSQVLISSTKVDLVRYLHSGVVN